jgi:hypothetical protein
MKFAAIDFETANGLDPSIRTAGLAVFEKEKSAAGPLQLAARLGIQPLVFGVGS